MMADEHVHESILDANAVPIDVSIVISGASHSHQAAADLVYQFQLALDEILRERFTKHACGRLAVEFLQVNYGEGRDGSAGRS